MQKEIKINRLPESWENKILPLMTLNENITLGGSLALYILDIMEYNFEKRTPDLDFSLLKSFTQHEFETIVDFFNLEINNKYVSYNSDDIIPIEDILKRDLIMLDHPAEDQKEYYKVDFFNKEHLTKHEYFELDYFGTTIKITHPSVIFSAKMKYATNNRVGKHRKHFQDIQKIDWPKYFEIVNQIQQVWDSVEGTFTLIKYIFELKKHEPVKVGEDLPF